MENLTFNELPKAVNLLFDKLENIERLLLQKPIEADNENLLTVKGAAEFLSLSVPTIYTKISKGELPVIKRDKRCYFTKADLMSYLKEGKVQIDGSDFLIKKGK